jgi:hypothetical protein
LAGCAVHIPMRIRRLRVHFSRDEPAERAWNSSSGSAGRLLKPQCGRLADGPVSGSDRFAAMSDGAIAGRCFKASTDQLGPCQQRLVNVDTQGPGGRQIDREVELHGHLHRQIARARRARFDLQKWRRGDEQLTHALPPLVVLEAPSAALQSEVRETWGSDCQRSSHLLAFTDLLSDFRWWQHHFFFGTTLGFSGTPRACCNK